MKIRIKTYNGELPSYFTVGKVYEATPSQSGLGATFFNDDGDESYATLHNSAHLDGGSWEVVNE